MAREQVITCDKCGAAKKEANHWYTVVLFLGYKAVAIVPVERWMEFDHVVIQMGTAYMWKDACGMEHALQLQASALQMDQPVNGSTEQRRAS